LLRLLSDGVVLLPEWPAARTLGWWSSAASQVALNVGMEMGVAVGFLGILAGLSGWLLYGRRDPPVAVVGELAVGAIFPFVSLGLLLLL
jgi:hypothetical protein